MLCCWKKIGEAAPLLINNGVKNPGEEYGENYVVNVIVILISLLVVEVVVTLSKQLHYIFNHIVSFIYL